MKNLQKQTNPKKDAFLEAYAKAMGNISASCEAIGIARQTYYDWCESDPFFKEAVANTKADERFLDFCEGALMKRINAGDTTAIIFALKCKGKGRGYMERTEQSVTHSINKPVKIVFGDDCED